MLPTQPVVSANPPHGRTDGTQTAGCETGTNAGADEGIGERCYGRCEDVVNRPGGWNRGVQEADTPGSAVDHVLHSEALSFNGYCFDIVEQPVEDGRGQGGVMVEDLGPVLVDAIGCDRDGVAFVALADDLEQQVGAGLVDIWIADANRLYS